MPYEAINFQDAPSTATPLNAATLNQLDQGMLEAHAFMRTHIYNVNLETGWTANVNATPGTPQVFKKRAGIVISEFALQNADPTQTTTTIGYVPAEIKPLVDVRGIALVNSNGTLQPVGYTIEAEDGRIHAEGLPTVQPFVLLLNLVYFI